MPRLRQPTCTFSLWLRRTVMHGWLPPRWLGVVGKRQQASVASAGGRTHFAISDGLFGFPIYHIFLHQTQKILCIKCACDKKRDSELLRHLCVFGMQANTVYCLCWGKTKSWMLNSVDLSLELESLSVTWWLPWRFLGSGLTCFADPRLPWEIKKLVSRANATVSHRHKESQNTAESPADPGYKACTQRHNTHFWRPLNRMEDLRSFTDWLTFPFWKIPWKKKTCKIPQSSWW